MTLQDEDQIEKALAQIEENGGYRYYNPLVGAAHEFIHEAEHPEMRVWTGLPELDGPMRGTAPGEITLIQGFCMTLDHEVLTPEGFKPQWEIAVGDYIWTMDPQTQTCEWQPVTDLTLVRHTGSIHHIKGRNIDASVTPNHRWGVTSQTNKRLKVKRTDKLNSSDHIPLARPKKDFGSYLSDDQVRLLGWVFTEGHYEAATDAIIIYQSHTANADKCWMIEETLDKCGIKCVAKRRLRADGSGESSYRIPAEQARWIRADFPDKMPTIELIDRMSGAQAKILVDTMILGDGYVANQNGHRRMLTTRLAEATILPVLVAHAGYSFSTKQRFHYTKYGASMDYLINIKKRNDTRVARNVTTVEPFDGMVWCPTVDNGMIFVRRGDVTFWTHNTHSGKTLLATEILRNNEDVPFILYTPDETRSLILVKLTSVVNDVSAKDLEERIRNDDATARDLLIATAERYAKLAVFDESVTLPEMQRMFDETTDAIGKPKAFMFDYAALLQGHDDVRQCISALKSFGKRNKVPGFVLHQASRTAGSAGKKMSIDSGSYGGEQEATHVIGVRRKKYQVLAGIADLEDRLATATNIKMIELYESKIRDLKHDLPLVENDITVNIVKNKRPPCELMDDKDFKVEPATGRIIRIEEYTDTRGNIVKVEKASLDHYRSQVKPWEEKEF